MSQAIEKHDPPRKSHTGKTARDLMTPNPVSIRDTATIPEVLAFLTDTGYSAAPVIDSAGRPIGVVSRTDVVVYERARTAASEDVPGYYHHADLAAAPSSPPAARKESEVRASDLMTPAVFSVAPERPALQVAEEMVQLNVHRLFVVDHHGILVGVISVLDLLHHFCQAARATGDGGFIP
jgi:CBS domain-containing protein